jgi:Ni/Co efflux regulator RcnB
MKKFALAIIAATALAPVAAAAQTAPAGGHPNAGVSWRSGGGNRMMMQRHQGGGNHMMMQRHQGQQGGNRQVFIHRRDGNRMMGGGQHMMRGGKHMMPGGHHGINRHSRYKRIDRGFSVPNFWWGPRFQISNWGHYGFSQPMNGGHWIRYFDDALLIDRSGRVLDGRWGMNWDRYQDQWAYDDHGIPYYGDDREDEDYGWDERDEGDYAMGDGPPPPPPPPPCRQACGHTGYGYGYGYGWMPGGMITITETTVHAAAPQTVVERVYVEKRVKAKPRRVYRAKPRPQPGERG